MPLYEYQCEECGELIEVIQQFSDDPLTTCPTCAGRLERLLSAPAIQFKGNGWYVTDYARSKSPEKDESAQQKSPPKETKSDPGQSKKPAKPSTASKEK